MGTQAIRNTSVSEITKSFFKGIPKACIYLEEEDKNWQKAPKNGL